MARPRAWFVVAGGNSMIMTIFCWHLSACYLVQGALLAAGIRLPSADAPAWLLVLPLWLAGCGLVCAALVGWFRRFEAARQVGGGSSRGAVLGLLGAAAGLFAVSRVGLDGLVDGQPVGTVSALLLVAAGYRLLGGAPAPATLAERAGRAER
jgi:hypothetical protein